MRCVALRWVEWSGIGLGTTDNGGVTGTKAWWGPAFDDPFPFSRRFLHHADLSKLSTQYGIQECRSTRNRASTRDFWNLSLDPVVFDPFLKMQMRFDRKYLHVHLPRSICSRHVMMAMRDVSRRPWSVLPWAQLDPSLV